MKNDNEKILQLIDLIYSTVEEPDLWSVLLGHIAEEINVSVYSNDTALDNGQSQRKEKENASDGRSVALSFKNELEQNTSLYLHLLPHLERASRLTREFKSLAIEKELVLGAFNHLPIGMVLLSTDADVWAMNNFATQILNNTNVLFVNSQKKLVTCTRRTTIELHNALTKIAMDAQSAQYEGKALSVQSEDGNNLFSLTILPLTDNVDVNANLDKGAVVFFTTHHWESVISEKTLIDLYQVTPKEAAIMRLLVVGNRVEDIAEKLNIKLLTVRTHIRSIFNKTDCHRQAELTHLVLTGPAIFTARPQKNSVSRARSVNDSIDIRENIITLPDKRRLSYAEYGAPKGFPLLYFHGLSMCRWQYFFNISQFAEYGIRLIVPERPGFGLSDFKEASILDYSKDIEFMLDHLNLGECSIAGHSSSGAFAAACAHELPTRIKRLAIIGSISEYTAIKNKREIPSTIRALAATARYAPALLRQIMPLILKGVRKNPDYCIEQILSGETSKADKELFDDPQFREHFKKSLILAVEHGSKGVCQELINLTRPWGFRLSNITTPIHFWYGDSDPLVPKILKFHYDDVPDKQYSKVAGQGHFFIYSHWHLIFPELIPRDTPMKSPNRIDQ